MENYDKSNGNEKIIDLIRKCLALSKSSNEHEASLALAKAQELLEKYNLSMAEVSIEQNKTPDLIKGKISFEERWQSLLIHNIARLNFCRTIRLSDKGTVKENTIFVLGRTPNVMVTYELASWLIPQLIKISLDEYSKQGGEYGFDPETLKLTVNPVSGRRWRQDFMAGITHRVIRRLEELGKERQAVNPSLVALTVNLSAESQAFLDREYPHRISSYHSHGYSAGYYAGQSAGDRVGLTAPSRHISHRQSLPEGRK